MIAPASRPCGACGQPAREPAAQVVLRLSDGGGARELRVRAALCPACHARALGAPWDVVRELADRWRKRETFITERAAGGA